MGCLSWGRLGKLRGHPKIIFERGSDDLFDIFVGFVLVDPESIWEHSGTNLDHVGMISVVQSATHHRINDFTVPESLFLNRLPRLGQRSHSAKKVLTGS